MTRSTMSFQIGNQRGRNVVQASVIGGAIRFVWRRTALIAALAKELLEHLVDQAAAVDRRDPPLFLGLSVASKRTTLARK